MAAVSLRRAPGGESVGSASPATVCSWAVSRGHVRDFSDALERLEWRLREVGDAAFINHGSTMPCRRRGCKSRVPYAEYRVAGWVWAAGLAHDVCAHDAWVHPHFVDVVKQRR
jgi:hypothetical protein